MVLPLTRFLRFDDPALTVQNDALRDLKQALSLQCVFVAGCCQRALALGSAVNWPAPAEICIGIVGCGMMGGLVAHALLDAGFAPSALLVSTRSPQRQTELAARGVRPYLNNADVASRAHLLLLAVLPAQLPEVSKSLRSGLSTRTLVLSLVGATPLAKLRTLLGAPRALAVAADATLPLLLEAQATQREEEEEAAATAEDAPRAGRLSDERVLALAAEGFAPDLGAARSLLEGLPAVLASLDLGAEAVEDACLHAAFGAVPPENLAIISAEVRAAPSAAPSVAPEGVGQAKHEPAADELPPAMAMLALRAHFVSVLAPLLKAPAVG